jgi:DNA end-binding protein Ku
MSDKEHTGMRGGSCFLPLRRSIGVQCTQLACSARFLAGSGDEKVPKDMLDLALHIVETKRGDFDPAKFEDQYEDALKELLRKKQKGEKIERPREPSRSNVVSLMDALRESVKAESGRGTQRRKLPRTEHRPAKKKAHAHSRRKKAS